MDLISLETQYYYWQAYGGCRRTTQPSSCNLKGETQKKHVKVFEGLIHCACK